IPGASAAAQGARFEAILIKAKNMLERCDWGGAERALVSLKEETSVPEMRAALLNLLGCCSCLGQDFQKGARYFEAALRFGDSDACVQQNLALVHEWQGKHAEAEPYWNGYFENVKAHLRPPPGATDYGDRLAFEGYARLATVYADKERWTPALAYAKQAHRLRPNDADILEKPFHLYTQSGRADEARRVLSQLRKARP